MLSRTTSMIGPQVRLKITFNARIINVGNFESCMVYTLRILPQADDRTQLLAWLNNTATLFDKMEVLLELEAEAGRCALIPLVMRASKV